MSLQITAAHGPAPQSDLQLDGLHLTSSQMDEMLVEPASPLQAHLLHCESCAAEFNVMQQSLHLFRDATHVYAEQQLLQLPERKLPTQSTYRPWLVPAYWATAAAVVMAAIVPLEIAQKRMNAPVAAVSATSRNSDTQSDVALLEEVDLTLSDSVPTSMRSLADPADQPIATELPLSNQTPQQGKD
jgi:hypothetical protein